MSPHLSPEEILRSVEEGETLSLQARLHLDHCPACAADADRIRLAASVLLRFQRDLAAPPAPAFRPRGARRRIARFLVPLAAAAAVLAGIALFWPKGEETGTPKAAPAVAIAEPLRAPAAGTGTTSPPAGIGPSPILEGGEFRAEAEPVSIRFGDETPEPPGAVTSHGNGARAIADKGAVLEEIGTRGFFLRMGRVQVHASGAPGFFVDTPFGRIVDLGTIFQVEVEASGAKASVVRGKVRIEPRSGNPAGVPPIELVAGQAAPIRPAAAPEAAPPDPQGAWIRKAAFPPEFSGEPLGRIFSLLEETGPFRIEAPDSLRNFRVSGAVNRSSATAILEAISTITGVPHRIEGEKAIFGGAP